MRKVAIAFLVASVLWGCSDDDDAATSTTSTTSTTSSSTSVALQEVRCESVAFTPNSEDAASDVRATGLTCEEAEAFVRVAGARTSSGGPAQLRVEGFRCVLTSSTDDPLPQAAYECTDGNRKVTFVRT